MQVYAFDKEPDAFTEVTDSKMFDVEPFVCIKQTFRFSILSINEKNTLRI